MAVKMRRQVIGKRRVAIGVIAQVLAVQPGVTVHVHAIKYDLEVAAGAQSGCREPFAIPARSSHEPACIPLTFAQVPVEGTGAERHHRAAPDRSLTAGFRKRREIFDAPIMRQIDPAPGSVIKRGEFGAGSITAEEAPAAVKRLIALVGDLGLRAGHRLALVLASPFSHERQCESGSKGFQRIAPAYTFGAAAIRFCTLITRFHIGLLRRISTLL